MRVHAEYKKIKELYVANSHLVRIFYKDFGITSKEYISKLRINIAKELLIKSNKGISEIAYECGYKNLSTFYDNFKRLENINPKSYRNNMNR